MRYRHVISMLCIFFSATVFSTAQVPDYLIYKGHKHKLHVNPLEEYFEANPAKRPKGGIVSSAMWRGYMATFSLGGGKLVVQDIVIEKPDPEKEYSYVDVSVVDQVFPSKIDREMSWFTGLLVIPEGKRTGYVHLSYASTYESYFLARIENGVLVAEVHYSADEYLDYKRKQFEEFKKTDAYQKLLNELSKDSEGKLDLNQFIFDMGGFTQSVYVEFSKPNK